MMMDMVMLNDSRISKTNVGRGTIMTSNMPITPIASIALLLVIISSESEPSFNRY